MLHWQHPSRVHSLAAVLFGAFLWLLPSAWMRALAQTPCLINFTSPQLVTVSGTLGDILIDDQCQHVYVANTSNNRIEVYSLQTGSLGTPISVGAQPTGIDTSPDGKTMYVANSGGNNVSIVDLTAGIEKLKVPVPSGFSSDTPFSIAVAQNGLVFFSTTFAGSGFGGRMLQLDPANNAVSPRTDFFFFGETTEATRLRASADRSVIGIVVGDISSAPVFRYASATNTFTPEKDLNGFVSTIALDGTGSVMLVNPGTFVLDANLNLSGTIPGGNFGVAADPGGAIGYSVGPARIDVLDLVHFLKTDSLAIGDTVNNGSFFGFGSIGAMAISRDGALLAVITDSGFSLVKTGVSKTVPFTAFPAHARLELDRGKARSDAFTVQGSFTLGSDSKGIDPVNETVTVQIGSATISIPSGSFKQQGDFFKFQGTVGGVVLHAVLKPSGRKETSFVIDGTGAQLAGTSLPLTVSLTIGDDSGSVKLSTGQVRLSSK